MVSTVVRKGEYLYCFSIGPFNGKRIDECVTFNPDGVGLIRRPSRDYHGGRFNVDKRDTRLAWLQSSLSVASCWTGSHSPRTATGKPNGAWIYPRSQSCIR